MINGARANNRTQPKLLVFSGPPCSGKTLLSEQIYNRIKQEFKEYNPLCLEMDGIRKAQSPSSDHNEANRNFAYHAMHNKARDALNKAENNLVILDATYSRQEHREAVVKLAKNTGAKIFLIECWVSSTDAVYRFRKRYRHPTTGLCEATVREISRKFPYYGGGFTLNTSKSDEELCLRTVISHVMSGKPLRSPDEWAKSGTNSFTAPVLPAISQVGNNPQIKKLSPGSKTYAFWVLVPFLLLIAVTIGLAIYGLIVFNHNPIEAQTWFTLATLIFASLAIWHFLVISRIKEARETLKAGLLPIFSESNDVNLSNSELYLEYFERSSKLSHEGFKIENVPIYFLIPPQKDQSFDVTVNLKGKSWDTDTLEEKSVYWGFDWKSYAIWLEQNKRAESYGPPPSGKVLRISYIDIASLASNIVKVKGSEAKFIDYLICEQSVNKEIPRQLPYMREFFEGDDWENKSLDLANKNYENTRYSMITSFQLLITTSDGFIVLQAKTKKLQTETGGVESTFADRVNWSDVSCFSFDGSITKSIRRAYKQFADRVNWSNVGGSSFDRSMTKSIRRACKQLGLSEKDFSEKDKHPFIAAAYNLKYGRDLNFYAHLACNLNKNKMSERFRKQTLRSSLSSLSRKQYDRWTRAHLIFIDKSWVHDNGEFDPRLETILGDARHVRGVLYACGISGRLK